MRGFLSKPSHFYMLLYAVIFCYLASLITVTEYLGAE